MKRFALALAVVLAFCGVSRAQCPGAFVGGSNFAFSSGFAPAGQFLFVPNNAAFLNSGTFAFAGGRNLAFASGFGGGFGGNSLFFAQGRGFGRRNQILFNAGGGAGGRQLFFSQQRGGLFGRRNNTLLFAR